MAEQIRVPFGTTMEKIREVIIQIAQRSGWDLSRVHYVIDLNASTAKETAYAVSNTTADLPLHPNGPDAVQRLA